VRRIAREGQLQTIIRSSPEGEDYQPSICGQSKAHCAPQALADPPEGALPQALLGSGLSLTRHSPPLCSQIIKVGITTARLPQRDRTSERLTEGGSGRRSAFNNGLPNESSGGGRVSIQILATGGEGVGVASRPKRMCGGTSDWDEFEESEMRELGEVTPAVAIS
jgi:hypothetical protein